MQLKAYVQHSVELACPGILIRQVRNGIFCLCSQPHVTLPMVARNLHADQGSKEANDLKKRFSVTQMAFNVNIEPQLMLIG